MCPDYLIKGEVFQYIYEVTGINRVTRNAVHRCRCGRRRRHHNNDGYAGRLHKTEAFLYAADAVLYRASRETCLPSLIWTSIHSYMYAAQAWLLHHVMSQTPLE